MMQILNLHVSVSGREEMQRSMDALVAFLRALEGSGEGFLCKLKLLAETSGGVIVDSVDGTTGGAGELQALRVLPNERYLELVSAVALHFDANIAFDHGWPILSSVTGSPTMTEGRGGSNAAPAEGDA
jgi:hypothetical protein